MNLTDKILAGMHGRLDITVVRKGGPYVPLHVIGISASGLNTPWTDLPGRFRQDKMVYIVHGEDIQGREFIFAEDTEIIDARPYFLGVEELGGGPHVQLWPHIHGTDAMHLTLLRRR